MTFQVKLLPKKTLFLLLGALLLAAVGAVATVYVLKQYQPKPVVVTKQPQPAPQKKEIVLAMMGDMLAHDSVVSQATVPGGYDFSPYFTHIKPLYEKADIVFCNAETPVAGDTLGVSGYPAFNAPGAFARDLAGAGCNLINLATNHISDKGQAGIDATRAVWRDQKGILGVSGANSSQEEQRTVNTFTVDDHTFAFVAFADFSNVPPQNGFSLNSYHDKALVDELLQKAREQAEFVIVSVHWGTEDSTAVNTDQRTTAQYLADRGADVIIGTGPHVLQAYETVQLTPIDGSAATTVPVWFSIGNMLSSQLHINQLTGGVALQTIAFEDTSHRVVSTEFQPTFMSYDWNEADRAVERLITRNNLQLRPLKDASASIPAMFPQASFEERMQFITTTLGSNVTVR